MQFDAFVTLHRRVAGDRPARPILEFGAGPGQFLIDAHGAGQMCHAIEVDPEMEKAFLAKTEALPELRAFYRMYEGRLLPYNSNYFGTVHSWFVLEHVEDLWTSLREIVRVTKPGGVILLHTQDARNNYDGHCDAVWPAFLPREFFAPYLEGLGFQPDQARYMSDVFYVTTPQLVSALEALGCEILTRSGDPEPAYLDALNVCSADQARDYGARIREQMARGAWRRPTQNALVAARKRDPEKAAAPLPSTEAAPAPIVRLSETRAPQSFADAQAGAPAVSPPVAAGPTYETVEIARRKFGRLLQDYEAAGEDVYLHRAPPLPAELVRDCRLLADRYAILDQLPKGGVVAEIGVDKGDFSRRILEQTTPAHLHLFDIEMERLNPANVADALGQGRVSLHAGDSAALMAAMPDAHFDWIYVDGDHRYEGVVRDIAASLPKLKPGGLFVFNDYTVWSPATMMHCGVMRAVNEFCLEHGWGLKMMCLNELMYNDVVVGPVGRAGRRPRR